MWRIPLRAFSGLVVMLILWGDVHCVTINQLAGYTFETNVSEHALLDLDQKRMEELTDEFKWSEANGIYGRGKNSRKSDSLRTLKGFSSEADPKLSGEGYWELYKAYYGNDGDYADKFVTNALNGVIDFAGKKDIFRAECANKGSQYQNVWMYVIHEMEDAINDCKTNDLNDNDKGVKAWDEAWAFYAGSLEGSDGAGEGFMLYALAEKRCLDFQLCSGGQSAPINSRVLNLMNTGRQELNSGDCNGAIATKNNIVKAMIVPVIQGALRYVESTRAKVDAKKEYDKEHAEGLAFVRAFLPILDHCDSSAANLVFDNFRPDANPPLKDGIDAVSNAIFGQLGCMGIACEDVGVIASGALPPCFSPSSFKSIRGTDTAASENIAEGLFTNGESTSSSSSSNGGLSGGGIAGIVVAAIVFLIIIGMLAWRKIRNKKRISPLVTPPSEGMAQAFV